MKYTVALKQNHEFRRLYSKGKNAVSPYFREVYRTHEGKLLPGYDIVIVARTRSIYGRFDEMERSFDQQMKKLGLIPARKGEERPGKGDKPQ